MVLYLAKRAVEREVAAVDDDEAGTNALAPDNKARVARQVDAIFMILVDGASNLQ